MYFYTLKKIYIYLYSQPREISEILDISWKTAYGRRERNVYIPAKVRNYMKKHKKENLDSRIDTQNTIRT